MRLVKNWKDAWKWHSTQAMTVAAAIPIVWAQLPTDLKQSIPDAWMPWIAGGVLVAGIIGRLRDQSNAGEN